MREKERERERKREKEREGERKREKEREREQQREKERERSITFQSISGFALPSVIHNNQPLLHVSYF